MRLLLRVTMSAALLSTSPAVTGALGAELKGVVRFNGLPVPGATVTASHDDQRFAALTDAAGAYTLVELSEGNWTLEVAMPLFETGHRELTMPAPLPLDWDLQAMPPEQIAAITIHSGAQAFRQTPVASEVDSRDNRPTGRTEQMQADPAATAELTRQAADGFLINGSVNNGAASSFAQLPAFGNSRRAAQSLYNGNLGLIANSSFFDARAFSLTGQEMPKPSYNRFQGLLSFGGPVRIPGLMRPNGTTFSVNYQWMRNRTASTLTGRMPTTAERLGDLSSSSRPALDSSTGLPFPLNRIPDNRISDPARQLLNLYPLPNFAGAGGYNFQTPAVAGFHQDELQSRVNKRMNRESFGGAYAMQSTRTDTPSIFGFLDTGRVFGWNASATYLHSFSARTYVNNRLEVSRLNNRVTPWFSNRRNVSADAGIRGNNQDPVNWGPPDLQFAGGIAWMTTPQASVIQNQTGSISSDWFVSRGRHNLTFGATRRQQQFNLFAQQEARGTFAFTGAAAGNDFAAFLLGVPDTGSVAFGNADKYLRASVTEGFFSDDWRVTPGLTINAGGRWEYWTPASEKYGRLVNLQVGPGFATAQPATARSGSHAAFPQPDRNNFAPRLALSWRPLQASSTVVRAGYGVYYDTSVYDAIATKMGQQAPLSTSLRLANTLTTPLTLATAFLTNAASTTQATNFGVDPGFRTGYLHSWQFALQTDLPGALQLTATYAGSKGTRGQQQLLPNTLPDAVTGPAGYTWLMSNGNSSRHSGQIQLRRRLRSGLAASVDYTWAKSIDNAASGGRNQGGVLLAQNWLDLSSERARSNFDQRNVATATASYTTGMGIRGGALKSGRLAALMKEWTFATRLDAATGLPQTPISLRVVAGTGVTGSVRSDYTGASVYDAPPGYFLNPAAFTAPPADRWGNAGRNSVQGPSQFVMNASISRSLRSSERIGFDIRLDAMNVLNSVNYTRWNTVAGNPQFGLPVGASAMRTVQMTARMRF